MEINLIVAVLLSICLLLVLILRLKIQPFIALLISSMVSGLMAGMHPADLIDSIQEGMGGTLGFVATVVGLGALFGAILEHSGGAESIATSLVKKFGVSKAPVAMVLTGFIIAIPVFFDVAFVILAPLIYSLQQKTKKSLLLFALPLLAGLAVTHTFIPPTPGPVAVAEILNAPLGWVITLGFLVGIPTSVVAGIWFSKRMAGRIHVDIPQYMEMPEPHTKSLPSFTSILGIIAVPILLIVISSIVTTFNLFDDPEGLSTIKLLGHPFSALIISNALAWYFLGIRKGTSKETLLTVTSKSLGPAGIIILLTGAGGVFKQILMDTGAGELLAESMTSIGIPVILFAFISAAIVRILQGSATVAMTTGAGLTASLIGDSIGDIERALLVIAIASGATVLSHVNDSGFWLVNRYLGLTEKQTFQTWTVQTTLIALCGFMTVLILSFLIV
ncbi:MAG: gluconate:H+ symporter [Bacteroidota bacterium]